MVIYIARQREFQTITSSRYYSLSYVEIDRPLMPSGDVTPQILCDIKQMKML